MKKRKRNKSEQRLQLRILRYLKAVGATAGKTKTTGVVNARGFRFHDPYTFRGFPDITVFFKNKLYFIEVKTTTRQTATQQSFEIHCHQAGISYIVAKSLDDITPIFHR